VFARVVSGLQARHVLGVAAWEVEPLEGLAPPHLQVSERRLGVSRNCSVSDIWHQSAAVLPLFLRCNAHQGLGDGWREGGPRCATCFNIHHASCVISAKLQRPHERCHQPPA
jgi:hypothetical protein